MKPIHRAIVFLQQARDILDDEARFTSRVDDGERLVAIEDAAEDIGSVLIELEQLDGAP
jgi:hypothetical protein